MRRRGSSWGELVASHHVCRLLPERCPKRPRRQRTAAVHEPAAPAATAPASTAAAPTLAPSASAAADSCSSSGPTVPQSRPPAPSAPPSSARELHAEVGAWLAKRKLEPPAALVGLESRHGATVAAYAAAVCEALNSPQPELRERERRALLRFAEQRAAAAAAPPPPTQQRHDSSSDEDEAAVSSGKGARLPAVEGGSWPEGLQFSLEYKWNASVPPELKQRYTVSGQPTRVARPSRRASIRLIREPSHPAYNPLAGQCGLFAARPLPRGSWVLDYVGEVSAGGSEDRASDYVSDFGDSSELALDANRLGNEARFINDYRNTGRRQNVEFRMRRDRRGALRQGVYVVAKGGVSEGEELLINYGKPFWRARVGGSLEEFVKVRPAGKPG